MSDTSYAAFIGTRQISPQLASVKQVEDWLCDSDYFLATIPIDILELDSEGQPVYY